MEPNRQDCAYYDCDKKASWIFREDYVTGRRIFNSFEMAVCSQHVPPCAGGEDPNFLWACGRPHRIKLIGSEDFTVHSGPWGFE